MHDGISLEVEGIPTAVIVTKEFVHEAHVQRKALGMPGIVPVIIEHPLSTLTDAQIRERAAQALPQAIAVWLGQAKE